MTLSIIPFTNKYYSTETLSEINSGNISTKTIEEISRASSKDLSLLANFSLSQFSKNYTLSHIHIVRASLLSDIAKIAGIAFAVIFTVFALTTSFSITALITAEVVIVTAAKYYASRGSKYQKLRDNYLLLANTASRTIHNNTNERVAEGVDKINNILSDKHLLGTIGLSTLITCTSIVCGFAPAIIFGSVATAFSLGFATNRILLAVNIYQSNKQLALEEVKN